MDVLFLTGDNPSHYTRPVTGCSAGCSALALGARGPGFKSRHPDWLRFGRGNLVARGALAPRSGALSATPDFFFALDCRLHGLFLVGVQLLLTGHGGTA